MRSEQADENICSGPLIFRGERDKRYLLTFAPRIGANTRDVFQWEVEDEGYRGRPGNNAGNNDAYVACFTGNLAGGS